MITIIGILAILWVATVFCLAFVYDRKRMEFSFWAIVIFVTPILNTIYCIKHWDNTKSRSFKDIWNDKL